MNTVAWLALAFAAVPLLLLALALLGCWWWKRGRLAALRSASHVVATPCGSIEYAVTGQGPPLLIVHGGMGGYDQALGLGALVNSQAGAGGFTVLAPSRPGYLRTPLETGRTPEEQADALAALLDHLGITQVGVLAGSYGGPFALQFALRHPHRLWALLLLAAIPRQCKVGQQWPVSERTLLWWPGTLFADLLHFFLYLWARKRPTGLVHFFLSRMTAPSVDAAEINRRVAQLSQFPEQVWNLQQLFRSMMPMSLQLAGGLNDEKQIACLPDYPLEDIRVPTLLIHGREDCVGLGAARAEWAAARIPGAELVLVDQCGHFLLAGEFLAPVFSTLAEFLRGHAPPNGGPALAPEGSAPTLSPGQSVSEQLVLSDSPPSREHS